MGQARCDPPRYRGRRWSWLPLEGQCRRRARAARRCRMSRRCASRTCACLPGCDASGTPGRAQRPDSSRLRRQPRSRDGARAARPRSRRPGQAATRRRSTPDVVERSACALQNSSTHARPALLRLTHCANGRDTARDGSSVGEAPAQHTGHCPSISRETAAGRTGTPGRRVFLRWLGLEALRSAVLKLERVGTISR